MISGNLLVKPLSAKLSHDTTFIGHMDPYVKCIVGNECHSSPPATNQHLTPSWNGVELPYRIYNSEVINFEVWNRGTLKDDFIGGGSIASFSTFSNTKTFCDWIPLRYQEKVAGSLLVEMQFFADDLTTGHESKLGSESIVPTNLNPDFFNLQQPLIAPFDEKKFV